MRKKKESNLFLRFFRLSARVWIVSIPTALILSILLLLGDISIQSALILLLLTVIFAGIIIGLVFKELENFIAYLRNLAQGLEIEPPHFNKGVFSSFRLADTFQSVKNRWLSQSLSDSQILKNLPDPLLMVDPAGQVVFANLRAEKTFGKDLVGRTGTNLFTGQAAGDALTAVLNGTQATEHVMWDYTANPEQYTFQARIERLPAPSRGGAVAVIILHDVTPFKRFREQQEEFFANASHELKTPLSIISGFIETLQGPARNDEHARNQFLSMMADQVERMTGLVQDLLKLARPQAFQQALPTDSVALKPLLQDLIQTFRVKAAGRRQRIRLNIGTIPNITGRTDDLRCVFQNLIDNALKYGAGRSTITVSATAENAPPADSSLSGPVVAVAVHNIGTPIAPDYVDKLFNRFYRVPSMATRAVEGTGLGLGIAQQIVQAHHGLIRVVSTPEDGTTFTVYLPVA